MKIDNLKGYCINLERARERRKNAKKEYKKLGIPFEIIKAVDGKKITADEIIEVGYDDLVAKRLRNRYKNRGLTQTEIACSLSHLKAYEKIISDKTPFAMVSEDDALFPFKKDYLEKILSELPNDWEICLLFHKGNCKKISKNICQFLSPPGSAVCYLLTLKGAEKLLKIGYPLRLAADSLTGRTIYKKELIGYGAFPVKVKHNDQGYSTILGDRYSKDILKEFYRFFSNRFTWVRRLKYFLYNKNKNFSDIY